MIIEIKDCEIKAIIESAASATVANYAALDTGLRAQVASEVERRNGLLTALGAEPTPRDLPFSANLKLQKLEASVVEPDRRVQGALADCKHVGKHRQAKVSSSAGSDSGSYHSPYKVSRQALGGRPFRQS